MLTKTIEATKQLKLLHHHVLACTQDPIRQQRRQSLLDSALTSYMTAQLESVCEITILLACDRVATWMWAENLYAWQ